MYNKIWFDLDNSPHVPFFRPILIELSKRNIKYLITAREHAQTLSLLNLWNIPHTLIGAHAGKNKLKKMINLISRSSKLQSYISDKDILAVSHGSRSQLIASWRLGLKSIVMIDYEFTESIIFNTFSSLMLIPKYIS